MNKFIIATLTHVDVNECLETNKHCGHNCHNTNGSYYCTCDAGFFLLEDKSGCTGTLFSV